MNEDWLTADFIDLVNTARAIGEKGIKTGAISPQLRLTVEARKEQAKKLVDGGMSLRDAAQELGVSPMTVSRDVTPLVTKCDSQLIQQSLSYEHYTPKKYIEAARATMGTIDMDPASCLEANEIVRATRFYTREDEGQKRDWGKGTMWLNPPYGDLVSAFIDRVPTALFEGLTAAIILVNAHSTDAKWFKPLWNGLLCFTDHRINFYGDPDRSGSTHGSVFVYFGDHQQKFAENFRNFGTIMRKYG